MAHPTAGENRSSLGPQGPSESAMSYLKLQGRRCTSDSTGSSPRNCVKLTAELKM